MIRFPSAATTPPPSRAIQPSTSNSSLVQQPNTKLIIDTSPLRSRQKLTDIDSKTSKASSHGIHLFSSPPSDPHDRFFEQENNIGFFAAPNVDQQGTAPGAIRRRVTSIFGDTQPEGMYHEPQKMTEDTLMDVRYSFTSQIAAQEDFSFSSFFRPNITIL